jgi:hypothetical protein
VAVFELFGLPQYAVMAASVPVSLIYSLIMVLTMYPLSDYKLAIQAHSPPSRHTAAAQIARTPPTRDKVLKLSLALMAFSGLVAIVYFLSVCLGALFGAGLKPGALNIKLFSPDPVM